MAVRIIIFVYFFANSVFALAVDPNSVQRNEVVAEENVLFPGKPIFDFQKYGWKVDVRVVPGVNASNDYQNENDHFPDFPFKDIGNCVLDFSFLCVKTRLARYIDDIDRLDDITLMGRSIRIVRAKNSQLESSEMSERKMIGESVSDRIDRTVNDFFNTHALRITLPRWNGKSSQINIMYDDTQLQKGRGKKGGGGKGGKCKKMMMLMVSMLKMKFMGMMGITAMKGMMMAGMSMMMSKMMLIMKLMSLKKGGSGGGGGSIFMNKPNLILNFNSNK